MGMGGISIWQLLIILVIVLLLFGTKRLKSIGSDLGNAVKGFRSAISDADKDKEEEEPKRLEETPPSTAAGTQGVTGAQSTTSAQPGPPRTATQDPGSRVENRDRV
jgi:sec-independent protein translocase protein TatA